MLWHFAVIATVCYSAFVSRVVAKNLPEELGTFAPARAWPVVVFGLRYGLLTAVATLRFCKQAANLSPYVTVEDAECFLTQFGDTAPWATSAMITCSPMALWAMTSTGASTRR